MRFYFYYDEKKFEQVTGTEMKAHIVREDIRQELRDEGKSDDEIEEFFRAFGI